MKVQMEMWILGGAILLALVFGGWAIARHLNNQGPGVRNNPPMDDIQIPPEEGGGASKNNIGLIRECPTSWYQNNMPRSLRPGESDMGPNSYLIINGKNYQESEVDLDWIKNNCEVNQPEAVY